MKIVITGAPCSGKTTILNQLKNKGHSILEEAARAIFADLQARGLRESTTLHQVQQYIYDLQVLREQAIDHSNKTYFLDRGWIDNQGYLKYHSGQVPQEFQTAPVKRYDAVFMLDRLPLINDDVRREDEKTAQGIHESILDAYRTSGYRPILIPAVGIEKRLELILNYTKMLSTKNELTEVR